MSASDNGQVTATAAGGENSPFMRRGCLIGLVLLTVMVSGLGYMFVTTLSEILPPSELRPYATLEETLKMVHSSAVAPGSEARLTETEVQFYLTALDSVNAPWEQLLPTIKEAVEQSGEQVDIIRSMEEFKEMIHLPFYARRGLVNYLNVQGKSWDQYLWAKARVIAASGITQQEAHTVLHDLYSQYFVLEEQATVLDAIREGSDSFYQRVDSLRKGSIDSTEIALVEPYRDVLLGKGLHSLVGIETMFPD